MHMTRWLVSCFHSHVAKAICVQVRGSGSLPRALLYATPAESHCVWDSEHSKCTIGLTITKRLLEGSNSEFSNLLLDDLVGSLYLFTLIYPVLELCKEAEQVWVQR